MLNTDVGAINSIFRLWRHFDSLKTDSHLFGQGRNFSFIDGAEYHNYIISKQGLRLQIDLLEILLL